MTTVIAEIEAERRRQIHEEGFDIGHDDVYKRGELAAAALSYVSTAAVGIQVMHDNPKVDPARYTELAAPRTWPWEQLWWKPKNPRRDLICAAALIVAQIERMDRAAK